MPREIALPKTLGPAQAAAWFESWAAVASEPELVLRVPAGMRLESTAVAWLASGLAQRAQRGFSTSAAAEPGAEDALRSLQRIEFFSVLGVSTKARGGRERGDALVPLRCITDERAARELADAYAAPLQAALPHASTSPLRMARFVYEELGVNIVQHSGAPATGFGLLAATAGGFELAFADRGIGFLASLQKNPELAGRVEDDAEALQLALGKGVTSTSAPRRNMGMGLGLLQDFSDRLGAELWIGSGSATLRRRTVAGARTSTVHANAPWPGSWIALVARLEEP